MEKIIQKAIEGGWKPEATYSNMKFSAKTVDAHLEHILHVWADKGDSYDFRVLKDAPSKSSPFWFIEMHRFIDHLASGGDAESFFKELLTHHN